MFQIIQIFRNFAAMLIQTWPAIPTWFSSAFGTHAAGNKNQGDKRRRGERDKGRTMFFLLRMAFWLGVVLVLLPTFVGSESSTPASAPSQMSNSGAVSAASATVADLAHFCERQPGACVVGAQVAGVVGEKAQAGAKILYDYLSDRSNPKTGSVTGASQPAKPALARKTTDASRDTLAPTDRTPAWRNPSPHKDARRAG